MPAVDRRRFLHGAALLPTAGLVGLSGCSSSESPPPRRSRVLSTVTIDSAQLLAELVDDPWVATRRDGVPINGQNAQSLDSNAKDSPSGLSVIGSLSPVGTAQAQKGGGGGGRGAVGRGRGSSYSDAPRTGRGRAKYHGGAYVGTWYDDHDDEVRRAETEISEVGIARIGPVSDTDEELPAPGPVSWDETWQNPDDTVSIDVTNAGWYRVGTHTTAADGTNLGWEAVDVLVKDDNDTYSIAQKWKVSPRI